MRCDTKILGYSTPRIYVLGRARFQVFKYWGTRIPYFLGKTAQEPVTLQAHKHTIKAFKSGTGHEQLSIIILRLLAFWRFQVFIKMMKQGRIIHSHVKIDSWCHIIHRARQTRLIVSHQPLTRFACGRVVIIHYSLLAKSIYAREIYGATAIKSGHVIAWKAIMTVEAAGLRGCGRWCETINLVCLA